MSRVEAHFGDVYIVSDGMGGHRGGAVAAELATEILGRTLSGIRSISSAAEVVKAAFQEANRVVYGRGHSGDDDTREMGSTAVVLLIGQSQAVVAHIGDSRAYLFARNELRRLTKDHSRVQRMVDAGILTDAEAASHPAANLLERAIGVAPDVEVDISSPFKLNAGDLFLLCSDGLHGYVSDSEIAAILNRGTPVQALVDELVDRALEKGGEDNITVQLIGYVYSAQGRLTPIMG
ncbi:protein phosphatase [Nitrosovibrio tenuis]|uniref:Protein phosphatase n=2 Tax=Nitrosovibrio tenuis TaxID=1233 RepID=A0A1H7MK91_9PROT|nr:protein phosphatase [Nitrosovibrio tenuis]